MYATLQSIRTAIEARGLSHRGAFHPTDDDLPDARDVGTLVLVGFTGHRNWSYFKDSPEARDGKPDPLDRWSLRVITALARELGATAFFPFAGPPWMPFQRWAREAEPVHPSPIGMLIHPDWGLWHSWRGALGFGERLELPPPDLRPRPCDTCADKPCLTTCPVNAFTENNYDVAACVAHISTERGIDCMEEGCRARRACPVGAQHRYTPDQASLSMRAFRAANRIPSPPKRGGEGWGEGALVTKQASKEREERKSLRIFARSMRHVPTEAEKKFWWMVRAHRLGGYKFKRQYPIGSYIADFVCLDAKLIVELDGAQHAGHKEYDDARDAFLRSKGFVIWRLWTAEFLENQEPVARQLLAILDSGAAPSP